MVILSAECSTFYGRRWRPWIMFCRVKSQISGPNLLGPWQKMAPNIFGPWQNLSRDRKWRPNVLGLFWVPIFSKFRTLLWFGMFKSFFWKFNFEFGFLIMNNVFRVRYYYAFVSLLCIRNVMVVWLYVVGVYLNHLLVLELGETQCAFDVPMFQVYSSVLITVFF